MSSGSYPSTLSLAASVGSASSHASRLSWGIQNGKPDSEGMVSLYELDELTEQQPRVKSAVDRNDREAACVNPRPATANPTGTIGNQDWASRLSAMVL